MQPRKIYVLGYMYIMLEINIPCKDDGLTFELEPCNVYVHVSNAPQLAAHRRPMPHPTLSTLALYTHIQGILIINYNNVNLPTGRDWRHT